MYQPLKKIIHVDMDCFYAAIEIRDEPTLANKPVAVGGSSDTRGVLTTCNYLARQYGIRSAMPTATAQRLCKDLVVVPVNMIKYRQVAGNIQAIFYEFTKLVEPLSLDEAYLDVTASTDFSGSATLIAKEIRNRIWQKEQLTASAGVAPNKFLAKVASGWRKPNGLFVIPPENVSSFVRDLSVKEIFGVGKVTLQKLHKLGLKTCGDLQALSLSTLTQHFGKFGHQLYEQCRGYDKREVENHRERKSISVAHTFPEDITNRDLGLAALKILYEKLLARIKAEGTTSQINLPIKKQFTRVRFNNFRQISCEETSSTINFEIFQKQFFEMYAKGNKPIRLISVGVQLQTSVAIQSFQQSFFNF